jgi:regulator of RNase E activity RraA
MPKPVLFLNLLSKKRYETINVSESDVVGDSFNPVNFPEVTLKTGDYLIGDGWRGRIVQRQQDKTC